MHSQLVVVVHEYGEIVNGTKSEQKRLRDIRGKLRQHPEFNGKKITIYRNQIHVDKP